MASFKLTFSFEDKPFATAEMGYRAEKGLVFTNLALAKDGNKDVFDTLDSFMIEARQQAELGGTAFGRLTVFTFDNPGTHRGGSAELMDALSGVLTGTLMYLFRRRQMPFPMTIKAAYEAFGEAATHQQHMYLIKEDVVRADYSFNGQISNSEQYDMQKHFIQ